MIDSSTLIISGDPDISSNYRTNTTVLNNVTMNYGEVYISGTLTDGASIGLIKYFGSYPEVTAYDGYTARSRFV